MGAETFGYVDWLYRLVESGLTMLYDLITLGLKQQKVDLTNLYQELEDEPCPANA